MSVLLNEEGMACVLECVDRANAFVDSIVEVFARFHPFPLNMLGPLVEASLERNRFGRFAVLGRVTEKALVSFVCVGGGGSG